MSWVSNSHLSVLQDQPIPHFMSCGRTFNGSPVGWLYAVEYDGAGIDISLHLCVDQFLVGNYFHTFNHLDHLWRWHNSVRFSGSELSVNSQLHIVLIQFCYSTDHKSHHGSITCGEKTAPFRIHSQYKLPVMFVCWLTWCVFTVTCELLVTVNPPHAVHEAEWRSSQDGSTVSPTNKWFSGTAGSISEIRIEENGFAARNIGNQIMAVPVVLP